MSKKLYEENNIRDIAIAIREQNGTSDSYTVAQMGNAVRAIKTQPDLETLTVTENGNYLPSAGKDGFSSVNVNVSGDEAVVQPLIVTENGTYNPPSGVDGYAPVAVNVSGGSLPPMLIGMAANNRIDTGVPGNTTGLKIQASIILTEIIDQAICGAAWSVDGFFLMVYNGKFRFHCGGLVLDVSTVKVYEKYNIECSSAGITVNGISYEFSSTPGANSSINISVFLPSYSSVSTTVAGTFMLENFKLYAGSTILRDFTPRLDPSDVASLYDAVTDSYFYKATGKFVYANYG